MPSVYSPIFPLTSDSSTTVLIQGSPHVNAVDTSSAITDINAFTTKLMPALGSNLPTSLAGAVDLTSGWLSQPTVNITFTDLTLETWVYMNQTTTGWTPSIFDTRPQSGSDGVGFWISSSAQLGFYVGQSVNRAFPLGGAVPLNTWTHVAWVLRSGQWTGYVNGVNTGVSVSNPLQSATMPRMSLGVTADAWSATVYKFLGKLYQPMITPTAKYTANFTPATDLSAGAASAAFFLNVAGNVFQDVISGNVMNTYSTVKPTQRYLV